MRRSSAAGAATAELLLGAGGEAVPGAGDGWAAGRYRGPYLRDALLDAGALVETLETVTFWSALPGLYAAIAARAARHAQRPGDPAGGPVPHLARVSDGGVAVLHRRLRPAGGSRSPSGEAAKAAAGEAILAAGGSITHHHGVGADHRELYPREVGPLGVEVLRAVKRTLDPAGILNPGILLAPEDGDGRGRGGSGMM